jgi:signal transduction histidine kinase
MTPLFRLRLGFLVGTIVLVAVLTLWGVQRSWQRITQLESKLTGSNLESFRLADDFQQRLLKLNNTMLRYASRREPAVWVEFERASTNLDQWIDHYDPRLNKDVQFNSERERELFQELNDAYDGYLTAGRQVHLNRQPAVLSAEAFAQLDTFEEQAGHLLQMGLQLADAHRKAEEFFVADANRSLGNLRNAMLAGVCVLLILVGALGVVTYRDQIAPLRTKLVHSEVLLEKQEKLATLGTLAAGIAHEIRNPLTSIKARLYTLDKHLGTPHLARKDAEIIGSEIGRLERIVQGVLDFARPSDPVLKSLSCQELLREIQAFMASGLEKRSVRIVLEPGPDLRVSADAGHLKQVLVNLVRNAVEAIETEGTVTLRVREDHAALDGELRETAVFEVADTGMGIPPEVEKRLFDPFFSTKETGTGLGLSVSARIVEKHGGRLQYQTRVGHGTTFGIVLPVVRAETAGDGVPGDKTGSDQV